MNERNNEEELSPSSQAVSGDDLAQPERIVSYVSFAFTFSWILNLFFPENSLLTLVSSIGIGAFLYFYRTPLKIWWEETKIIRRYLKEVDEIETSLNPKNNFNK